MNIKPILYAEDEETDAFFLTRAFSQAKVPNSLIVVPHGQGAIDYLSGNDHYGDRTEYPMPCLILLDLNMPRKSGLEVLEWIREQPTTCTLPVIILTSSLQQTDIRRCYEAGANAYLAKPSQPDELGAMVTALRDFWLGHNQTCD